MAGLFPSRGGPQSGLLAGRQQAPQQAPRKPNMLDRILGLYGADPATHIPQEARRGALGEGLFQAGLQTVMAGGRGHDSLTTGQAVGSMLGGMRQQGPRMAQEQRMNQIREMAASGQLSAPQLQAIMMELISAGQTEEAKVVASVLNSLGDTQDSWQRTTAINPETGLLEHVMLNPKNPDAPPKFTGLQAPASEGGGLQRYAGMHDGKAEWATFDPSTGKSEWMGVAPPEGAQTELQMRAGMFIGLADNAEAQIQAFLGVPGRLKQIINAAGLNELLPEDYQLLYVAGEQLGDAYLRLTSGAAIKEEEIQMFIHSFLPYPGDTEATVAFKKKQRDAFIRGLKIIGSGSIAGADQFGGENRNAEDEVNKIVKAGGGVDITGSLQLPEGGDQYIP